MRKLIVVLVAAIAAAIYIGNAAACNPGWSRNPDDIGSNVRYKAGYSVYPDAQYSNICIQGVDNQIYMNNPSLHSGGSEFSAAWDGLDKSWTDTNGSVHAVVGQIGYLKRGDAGLESFSQVAKDTSIYSNDNLNWTPPSVGSTNDYKVTYSAGAFHMFYNGTNYSNWGFTEGGIGNSTCFNAAGEGETNSYADQMVGTSTNKELFSYISVQGQNGVWNLNTTSADPGGILKIQPFKLADGGSGNLSAFNKQIVGEQTPFGFIKDLNVWDSCS